MKRVLQIVLMVVSAGGLMTCQEITPLTPPNPILGNWQLISFQVYHLPAWYIAKTKTEYLLTPTDTIYGAAALAATFNVQSYTFTQDHSVSERYPIPERAQYGLPNSQAYAMGSWTLADSVVTLTVNNDFPHKLTYSRTMDRLVSDIFPQTSVVKLSDDYTYMVSYSIRLYYQRSP